MYKCCFDEPNKCYMEHVDLEVCSVPVALFVLSNEFTEGAKTTDAI